MAKLKTQKRLAAEMFNVGINRVWLDPTRLTDISQAITKADIAQLIKEGVIKAKSVKGKKKRAGHAERKVRIGKTRKKVRKKKERYVNLIRKLRRYLEELKQKGIITANEKGYIRRLAKAGQFKSRRHLKEYIKKIAKKPIEEIEKAEIGKAKKLSKTKS